MISVPLFCILSSCIDVPVNINNRQPWEQFSYEFQRQNPPKVTNPSCYVDGEFFKSCPDEY